MITDLVKTLLGFSYEKNVLTTSSNKFNISISLDAVEPKDNIVVFYNDFEPKKTKKDERITAAIAEKKVVQLKDLAEFVNTH